MSYDGGDGWGGDDYNFDAPVNWSDYGFDSNTSDEDLLFNNADHGPLTGSYDLPGGPSQDTIDQLLSNYSGDLGGTINDPGKLLQHQGGGPTAVGGGIGDVLGSLLKNLGSGATGLLGNLGSSLGNSSNLAQIIAAAIGKHDTSKNTQFSQDQYREFAKMQDPWLNKYAEYQPKMDALMAGKDQSQAMQLRNQAMQGLASLVSNSEPFKWGR